MSTFNGIIEEIPNISIDRFDERNLKSTVYFLSHVHSDHMTGFNSDEFKRRLLEEKHIFLYASAITCKMLENWFPEVKEKFLSLPIETISSITIPGCNRTVAVNVIPAGHCPGSIMFLFETNSQRILYTGDFRLNINDLHKYKVFYNTMNQLKHINRIYLDTTFLNLEYKRFPDRDESKNHIFQFIDEWIQLGKERMVHIKRPAKYGFEFLFIEISKRFKMPIHVNQDTYDIYRHFPEMDAAITLDCESTQIHSFLDNSNYVNAEEYCNFSQNVFGRIIHPTAFYWNESKLNNGNTSIKLTKEYCRVCYSSHASYEELVSFMRFFKADTISPNVVPTSPYKKEVLYKLIDEIVNEYKGNDIVHVSNEEKVRFTLLDVDDDTLKDNVSDEECDLSTPVVYDK